MPTLTDAQRRQVAREYETRKTRGEAAADIALRWGVAPYYVTMIARQVRSGHYEHRKLFERKRAALKREMLAALRVERERAAQRRRKRKARIVAILRDYKAGVPIAEIARRRKCSPTYPAQLAKRAGFKRRTKLKRTSAAERAAILRDYQRGVPVAEIARKYGRNIAYAGQLAKRSGLPTRTSKSSPAGKAEKAAILRDYKRGVPVAEIARKWGRSPSYPSRVAKLAGLPLRAHAPAR